MQNDTEMTKEAAIARLEAKGYEVTDDHGIVVDGPGWNAYFSDNGNVAICGDVPDEVYELAVWDDSTTREE